MSWTSDVVDGFAGTVSRQDLAALQGEGTLGAQTRSKGCRFFLSQGAESDRRLHASNVSICSKIST